MEKNNNYIEAVNKIIKINKQINDFWSNAKDWAPKETADLLSKSRLDWLLSLSYSLKKWDIKSDTFAEDGDLILAWVNLGTLVEGSLKVFLCIYYEDYKNDINKITNKGIMKDPDTAFFNHLIIFFRKNIWSNEEIKTKNKWLEKLRDRRNAVHAFQDREIDDFFNFKQEVINFSEFLENINNRLPYPESHF